MKYNLLFLITFYSLRLLNGRTRSIEEIMVQTGFEMGDSFSFQASLLQLN